MNDPIFEVIQIAVALAPGIFWISLAVYIHKVIRPKVEKKYGRQPQL